MGPVPWDVFQNSPGTKLLHSRSSVKDRELYIGLWWTHSSIMEVQLFCSLEKALPLFLFNVPLNSPGWPLYGFSLCLLEKEMATHSSTFARKIPWTEEPGRLQSTGLQRVRHDWATSLSLPPLWFLVLLTVAVMDLPSLDLLLVEPTADIADSQTSDAMISDPLGVPQDTSP